jgi:hypothetical protein
MRTMVSNQSDINGWSYDVVIPVRADMTPQMAIQVGR